MAKAANKTKATSQSVDAFVDALADESIREDCRVLLKMMKRITGNEPRLWSNGIVGFGDYHYKSASGREGDWFMVGFSPRKANLTITSTCGYDRFPDLIKKLGPHKTGGGCLYIKRLKDVDLSVLEQLMRNGLEVMAKMAAS